MKIHTSTLGTVEAGPESFLTLPEGLVGFEEQHEFVLLELADYRPFRWLLSFTDPGLSFPLLDPRPLIPDYRFEIPEADRLALDLENGVEPQIFVVACVGDEGDQVTVNLRAPLLLHPARQLARQVVLPDSRWNIQHPILDRAEVRLSA